MITNVKKKHRETGAFFYKKGFFYEKKRKI